MSYELASSPDCSAWKVVTLKNSVPTSSTPQTHQSIRCGSNETTRKRRFAPSGSGAVLIVSSHWSNAADVKKIEPTKKTTPSTAEPTHSTNPGNGATRKHVAPIANRTAIHHEARRGAHQTPPDRRDSLERPFRCRLEDHSASRPSANRHVTCVVNGPTDLRSATSHPGGVAGYERAATTEAAA